MISDTGSPSRSTDSVTESGATHVSAPVVNGETGTTASPVSGSSTGPPAAPAYPSLPSGVATTTASARTVAPDPFGITITEALEAGTQVVSTRCGAAEILPDDCLVEVVPDSESIVDGLDEALDREELPEYDRRDWSAVAEDTLEVYEDVV